MAPVLPLSKHENELQTGNVSAKTKRRNQDETRHNHAMIKIYFFAFKDFVAHKFGIECI